MSSSSSPSEDAVPVDDVNARNGSEGSEDEDDPAAPFAKVLARVRLDEVPLFCLHLRTQIDLERGITQLEVPVEPIVIGEPLFGSYHVLFPIHFADGLQWLLKVPANGTETHFDKSAAASLTSEAMTMSFLRRETSIPIPNVFAFEASLDNQLGCPFIVLEFVSGISLYDCWFDESKSVPEDVLHSRRSQALQDIAAAMAQMDRFSFDSGGSMTFDEKGSPAGNAAVRCMDHKATFDRVFQGDDADEERHFPCYYSAGPWTEIGMFYLHALDQQTEPAERFQLGLDRLLRLLIGLIPGPNDTRPKFVLAHPDFDIQNFIMSEDGHLRAVIDWDGVQAVPRSIGYESYPGWLTRDWDPAMYGWTEDMERGVPPVGVMEDSPALLAHHRAEYKSFMQSSLTVERSRKPGLASAIQAPPSRTAESLYVENLLIAASNPVCKIPILTKMIEEAGNMIDEETPEDFNVFDIADTLAEGELDQERFDRLQNGFRALFGV